MAVNPYTTQSISGYNATPPPDDGSQTAANKVTWDKHKTKLGDPVKTLAEAINTQTASGFNILALKDWTAVTTTATVAETDWHNGILMLASGGINYPAPGGFENGWHNYVYNAATGVVGLRATATNLFRSLTGTFASGIDLPPGQGVQVMNTATIWILVGMTTTATTGLRAEDTDLIVAAQVFGG
jgi:hypothetical protein